MSVLALEPPVAFEPQVRVTSFVVDGDVVVPAGLNDLTSFRAWCLGPDYPERGQIEFLDGEIWVDLTMEDFFEHNQVRDRIWTVLAPLIDAANLGYSIPDRMRLTNPAAKLSCEPDAAFVSWEAVRSGRVEKLVAGADGIIELVGSPDMVLEVVSKSSVRKDTKVLPLLYHRAGIPEYWLIDVRKNKLKFDLFRYGPEGYTTEAGGDGWSRSAVFGREFRLTRGTDPLGNPRYRLEVR